MQGVVRSYDPVTRYGVVVDDKELNEYDLAPNALENSLFRMLRQGQRILFDVDEKNQATRIHIGSEEDMGTPERFLE